MDAGHDVTGEPYAAGRLIPAMGRPDSSGHGTGGTQDPGREHGQRDQRLDGCHA
jgi:hypothetical protein